MHPEEDEKRTEVRGQNTPKQKRKTVKMASLQCWLRRPYCCCSQELRYDLRARSGGLTVVEILPVAIIIAIRVYLDCGLMGGES
jgi:hypothetical protein